MCNERRASTVNPGIDTPPGDLGATPESPGTGNEVPPSIRACQALRPGAAGAFDVHSWTKKRRSFSLVAQSCHGFWRPTGSSTLCRAPGRTTHDLRGLYHTVEHPPRGPHRRAPAPADRGTRRDERSSAARVCPGRCPFVIPERSTANYRLVMVFALAELALVALIIGLLVLGGWAAWAALRSGPPGPGGPRLAPRPRAQL